mgnify:CR=1 FL=1
MSKHLLFVQIFLCSCIIFGNITLTGCMQIDKDDTDSASATNFLTVGFEDAMYNSIQKAVENASEHDTIFIQNGVYYGPIIVDTSIHLIGENSISTKILIPRKTMEMRSDDKAVYGVLISADNCSIKNITIQAEEQSQQTIGVCINGSNSIVENTIVSTCNRGINIGPELFDKQGIEAISHQELNYCPNNNTIKNNIITDNNYGIYNIYCSFNNISSNKIYSNSISGIHCYIYSNNNSLYDNDISMNEYGIRFKSSRNNWVSFNNITKNTKGIYVCCGSQYNQLWMNNFMNNSMHALDFTVNQWSNDTHGNYWDDYKTAYPNVTATQGRWNNPYNISKGPNFDYFPLTKPIE